MAEMHSYLCQSGCVNHIVNTRSVNEKLGVFGFNLALSCKLKLYFHLKIVAILEYGVKVFFHCRLQ